MTSELQREQLIRSIDKLQTLRDNVQHSFNCAEKKLSDLRETIREQEARAEQFLKSQQSKIVHYKFETMEGTLWCVPSETIYRYPKSMLAVLCRKFDRELKMGIGNRRGTIRIELTAKQFEPIVTLLMDLHYHFVNPPVWVEPRQYELLKYLGLGDLCIEHKAVTKEYHEPLTVADACQLASFVLREFVCTNLPDLAEAQRLLNQLHQQKIHHLREHRTAQQ